MKKRYIDLLIILVIAAVLTAAFSGCKKKEEDTSLDDLNAAVSWYEEMLASAEGDDTQSENQKFVVVIPAGCGADLFYGADFLSQELSKYVGYEVRVVYDTEYKESAYDLEILIGKTNRNQSISFTKKLRVDDYGYELCDGALLIGAQSEALCIKAIDAFVDALLQKNINPFKVNLIKPYSVRGNYKIAEIKLCGFEICEYDIVYPENNTMYERELAGALRDAIAEYSGYSLRIISDKQSTDATKAICVGKSSLTTVSCAKNEAIVSARSDGNVELVSDKNAGIYHAVQSFVELIKQAERDGACCLEAFGTKNYSYNGDKISFFIVKEDIVGASVEETSTLVLAARDSSLSIFSNLSELSKMRLESNLETIKEAGSNKFYYVDGVKVSCVYEKSELLSGGELLTLVMERSDGKRFAFIAGFAGESADGEALLLRLNEECKKYAELPLVVMHDLDDSLDRRFDDSNESLCAVSGFYGLYYSLNNLLIGSASVSDFGNSASAEVICFDFYYA